MRPNDKWLRAAGAVVILAASAFALGSDAAPSAPATPTEKTSVQDFSATPSSGASVRTTDLGTVAFGTTEPSRPVRVRRTVDARGKTIVRIENR